MFLWVPIAYTLFTIDLNTIDWKSFKIVERRIKHWGSEDSLICKYKLGGNVGSFSVYWTTKQITKYITIPNYIDEGTLE